MARNTKRAEREALINKVTGDVLHDKFTQEVGARATVERTVIPNDERTEALRDVVRDIATDMQTTGLVTKGLTYMGSLTVHVFGSEVLRMMEFAPLTVTDRLDANRADAAVHALRNSVLTDFGRRIQKKRSGF